MGERNYTPKEGGLIYEMNGEWHPLELLKSAPGITITAEEENIVVDMPRISRKRYIKLLMSDGMSRNDARECAKTIHENRRSYVEGYLIYLLYQCSQNNL